MKMYVTGCNKNIFYSDNNNGAKTMLHFDRNCSLLAGSNSGVFDIEFPMTLTFEHASKTFPYEGKEIACCSKCSGAKFRNEFEISFQISFQELEQERKQKIIEKAREKAKSLHSF